MAGVAINGSQIVEVIKEGHVTYSIERWVNGYCREFDDDGNCIDWVSGYWTGDGNGSTGAKIQGTVSTSSKMKVNGASVAYQGDTVNFTWEASPPIPSNDSSRRYTATSPTSGSGTGTITSGSNKGKLNNNSIALIGSQVSVLGVTTTIANGNNKLSFNS